MPLKKRFLIWLAVLSACILFSVPAHAGSGSGAIIDKAVAWAISIADDDSHGYNNSGNGWGPGEYNCIGLVITAYMQAGVNLTEHNIQYEPEELLKAGFKDVTGKVDLSTGKGLIKGDVLWLIDSSGVHGHTELVIAPGQLVGARGDYDGVPGDSSGGEITTGPYVNMNWQKVFRLDPEDDELPVSGMYPISSALAAYGNTILSPKTPSNHDEGFITEADFGVGVAGAFLGYGDESFDHVGYMTVPFSASSSVISYESLLAAQDGSYDRHTLYSYARYGTLLKDLGLDSVGSDSIYNLARGIAGGVMYLMYMLCLGASLAFDFAIRVLRTLNPFALLSRSSYLTGMFNNEFYSTDVLPGNAGYTRFARLVSSLFDTLHEMSVMVMVPLLIAFALVSVLLLRKTQGTWKWVARFAFIFVGIPLFGVLYTFTLEKIDAKLSVSSGTDLPVTEMVASSFTRFDLWASNKRLAPQSGMVLESDPDTAGSGVSGGTASTHAVANLRNTTYALNKALGIAGENIAPNDTGNPLELISGLFDPDTHNNEGYRINLDFLDLLGEYTKESYYYPSDWESAVMAKLKENHSNDLGRQPTTEEKLSGNVPDNENTVQEMMDDYCYTDAWLGRDADENGEYFDWGKKFKGTDGNFNFLSNGGLAVSAGGPDQTVVYSVPTTMTAVTDFTSSRKDKGSDPAFRGGLSTQSMYNYLASSFQKTSMYVYSSRLARSQYIKESHHTANLVGSGVLHYLYYASCFAMMFVTGFVGFSFALRIMVSSIRKGISLLATIPGSSLGMMSSITRFVTGVLIMIFEVIGTIFVYEIFSELLRAFVTVTDGLLSESFDFEGTILGGWMASIFSSSVTIDTLPAQLAVGIGIALTAILAMGIGFVLIVYRKRILYAQYTLSVKTWEYFGFDTEVLAERSKSRQNDVLAIPEYAM